MERQAPKQLLYENQLPLAVESKSTRRLFFPEGGATYGPPGGANPNIIRIPINADSLLDVQHSYLQFDLNATAANTRGIAPDIGVPFIRRLRIESAGTTLEDIDEYGKLYGNILFPAQASNGAVQEATITTKGIGSTQGQLRQVGGGASAVANIADADVVLDGAAVINAGAVGNAGDIATAIRQGVKNAINTNKDSILAQVNGGVITAAGPGNPKHAGTTSLRGTTSYKYSVSLVSALLNMEKYLPLVMMNAGITLELELDVAGSVGLQSNNFAAGDGVGNEAPEWTISNVRYAAHLIDLQRDFYDKMRMVMEGSGGVLQLTGSTFRHYAGSLNAAADGTEVINLPARVKSIQSVFFVLTPAASKTAANQFGVSNSLPMGLTEYQFRIGSVVYPPTAVKIDKVGTAYTNKGEAYSELRKAFGTLGNYLEGGFLNNDAYLPASDTAACAGGGTAVNPSVPLQSPFGLDFQSFPKTALESGVNTSDRSLNMSLNLVRANGPAAAGVVDAYVMSDAIFYVNLDGSVSVSV